MYSIGNILKWKYTRYAVKAVPRTEKTGAECSFCFGCGISFAVRR